MHSSYKYMKCPNSLFFVFLSVIQVYACKLLAQILRSDFGIKLWMKIYILLSSRHLHALPLHVIPFIYALIKSLTRHINKSYVYNILSDTIRLKIAECYHSITRKLHVLLIKTAISVNNPATEEHYLTSTSFSWYLLRAVVQFDERYYKSEAKDVAWKCSS